VGAVLGAGNLTGQRKEELEYSKEILFADAAEAFYALLAAEKTLSILDESIKLFEERIRDLQEREKIGRSRSGEVAMARAKKKILEARIAKSRGALLSAQSLVSFYTGIAHVKAEDEDPETFSETLDIDPANYEQIIHQRSDVAAAREAVGTAKQTIVVKQSALWPRITLDANHYEKREGFQDGITWDALIKMNVPLYRGGDNIGQVWEAKSNYNKARLNYELVRKRARLELEQAHQSWIASREEHRAFQAAVLAGQENFDYQREDYAHNLVSNLDVLAALEELLAIREEANQVHYAMKTNYWKLQIAANHSIPEWAE
jgi:outer membrane protein TolC